MFTLCSHPKGPGAAAVSARARPPRTQNIAALLADGLVDELHLFVYPLTRGTGPRLFPEDAAPGNLSLAAGESYRTVWFTWPTDRRREAAASRSRTPAAASSRGG